MIESLIKIFVRGEVVYNGDSQEFTEGWKRSVITTSTLSGFDFILRPDRQHFYRNGETVEVKVVLGTFIVETWTFTAKARGFRSSTFRFILRSIRNADAD